MKNEKWNIKMNNDDGSAVSLPGADIATPLSDV
jgi:hypothetical protein